MRSRFEKAVSEIRALKRELRESQAQCDWLELSLVSARQEGLGMKNEAEASSNLMAARIQDLASKLSASEKQVRNPVPILKSFHLFGSAPNLTFYVCLGSNVETETSKD